MVLVPWNQFHMAASFHDMTTEDAQVQNERKKEREYGDRIRLFARLSPR